MTRKMLKEEKELRKYLKESVTDDYPNEFITIRKEWNLLITALVRAVREDCIDIYYDWESRPREAAGVTFPDAVRENKRWRIVKTAIRGKK